MSLARSGSAAVSTAAPTRRRGPGFNSRAGHDCHSNRAVAAPRTCTRGSRRKGSSMSNALMTMGDSGPHIDRAYAASARFQWVRELIVNSAQANADFVKFRSEERRVGKECGSRWERYRYNRKGRGDSRYGKEAE